MGITELVGIAVLGTVSGLMIGCIGIGGVILVPALVFLAGIAIHNAIPAAMQPRVAAHPRGRVHVMGLLWMRMGYPIG